MDDLTHLDERGQARMVDVGDKEITKRTAKARATVQANREIMDKVKEGNIEKGDVAAVSRIAGIMAVKKTSELIPLSHKVLVDTVEIDVNLAQESAAFTATVKGTGRTGYEMEALTAVSVAALTFYDMCKSMDKTMTIKDVELVEKTGGKSGDFKG